MVNRIETIRVIKEVRSWKNFSGHCGQQRPKPNSPSLGKGWPEAGVGALIEAVKPLLVTRNSAAHITTPPFGHPFYNRRGIGAAPALRCRGERK